MPNIVSLDTNKGIHSNSKLDDRLGLTKARLQKLSKCDSRSPLIYWEYQELDRMCALHALNCLVQGPKYDEAILSRIADELDRRERSLINEPTSRFLTINDLASRESGNAASDGFFSYPVLVEAMKSIHATISSIPKKGPNLSRTLLDENGILLHHAEHWLALRKIRGKWYSLDSLQLSPLRLSDSQFLALISFLIEQPYFLLFVVRGLPESFAEKQSMYLKMNQVYLSETQVNELGKMKEMQGMIASLLFETLAFQPDTTETTNEVLAETDPDLEKALLLSIAEYSAARPSPPPEANPEDPTSISIQIRLSDGSTKVRTFYQSDMIESIFLWAEKSLLSPTEQAMYSLLALYPRREFIRFGIESKVLLVQDEADIENQDVTLQPISHFFSSRNQNLLLRLLLNEKK